MNKRIGRRYTATEQANSRPLPPAAYRSDGEDNAIDDPRCTKRVAQIHNHVISTHTHGLVQFVGDELILAVDPARLRELEGGAA